MPVYKYYKKVIEDQYFRRILYLKKNWILRNLLTCDFEELYYRAIAFKVIMTPEVRKMIKMIIGSVGHLISLNGQLCLALASNDRI